MGVRPGPTDKLIDSSIFMMDAMSNDRTPNEQGEGDKNIDYAERMKIYVDKYYSNTTGMEVCRENRIRGDKEKSCIFNVPNELGDCGSHPYGYVQAGGVIRPCIFIKFNKIFGWKPRPIEDINSEKFKDMPQDLKDHIGRQRDKSQIWIDCRGRYSADREALSLEFFPSSKGIPVKYFPYLGPNYNPPPWWPSGWELKRRGSGSSCTSSAGHGSRVSATTAKTRWGWSSSRCF